MSKFPKDTEAALNAYFGDPAKDEPGRHLVTVKPPFYLWYGDKKVTAFSFHEKAAPAIERVFAKIWEYYGKDQKLIDKLEISFYSGAYNHRLVRGSTTKWSNHARGSAYDMDAEDNALGAGRGDIPFPVIAAFKSEGFCWGGDYHGRTDPMHFEACDRGDPVWSFAQWLAHYKCPPMGATKAEVKTAPVHSVPKAAPAPVPAPAPAPVAAKPKPAPVAAKPAAKPADPFDMGDSAAIDPPDPNAPVIYDDMPPGVYSIETEIVQTTLERLGYKNVGAIDGKFGGATRGAIAAFLNDRHISGQAHGPGELKAELTKATAQGFTRPIAEERANATPQQLAATLPEVKSSINAERTTFWGSIVAGASGLLTGLVKSAGDAVEMLDPVKTFLSDVPWPFWVGGTLLIAGALYAASRMAGNAKNEATKAYQEGART